MLLRLTQQSLGPEKYRIETAFDGDGGARQIVKTTFDFALTPQEQENLRWYLEDFLSAPHDPAPTIAARIEQKMKEIGETLFRAVFQSNDDGRDLRATLRTQIDSTRVEVFPEVEESTLVPWELMRDPKTDTPLALRARAFVRTQSQPVQPTTPPTGRSSRRATPRTSSRTTTSSSASAATRALPDSSLASEMMDNDSSAPGMSRVSSLTRVRDSTVSCSSDTPLFVVIPAPEPGS